jgi:hypothetical protein
LPVNSCAARGYPGWIFGDGGIVDMLRITRGRGVESAAPAPSAAHPPYAAEAFLLTPLRSATLLSLVLAAFSVRLPPWLQRVAGVAVPRFRLRLTS